MRNIPVIGKFLVILCVFGLFVAGVAGFSTSRISFINTSYSTLLDEDSEATLMLARASRSLVSIRSAIADILIARARESGASALVAHGYFNAMIGRNLRNRGFSRTGSHRVRYWNAVIYEGTHDHRKD